MFSGIVEAVQKIMTAEEAPGVIRIKVERPQSFDDIKLGDSISTDGVCLTVEKFDSQTITFALAPETLKVLNWKTSNAGGLAGRKLNLERSLRFGDRIHGHLVTGHVDSLATVKKAQPEGESFFLDVEIKDTVLPYVWKKGSITLNGVSLTVNEIQKNVVSVCLIPETLKRTNLGDLKVGDFVNVEPDYMARAVLRGVETGVVKYERPI
jgi:riboflavin synthase